jgi:aminoglycoside phosphotransferase (APT) family kinase protein
MRMGMNAIFAAGDGVLLRVGRPSAPAQAAIELAATLSRSGVRVPTYLRDQPYEEDDHAVFAIAEIHDVGAVDWRAVGQMIARLHQVPRTELPAAYPIPFGGDFPWWDFESLLNDTRHLLDAASLSAIEQAVGRDRPLLDEQRGTSCVVCHGDLHPGNVIQSADGPVLLDWDLLCLGPPAWDHGPLMTWTERWGGEPGIYEAFADGAEKSLRDDPVAEAIAELRLAAATLMLARAAQTNASAAEEVELRLRYWRGEPDAPQWQPQ